MRSHGLLLALAACAASSGSSAGDLMPGGAFVEGGVGQMGAGSVTIGALWPWAWRGRLGSAEASGVTELFASYWSARTPEGREGYMQVGLLPVFRLRPAGGASPWFLEGGIGLSAMDRRYRTQDKLFSTRFNFVDVIGAGHSFGADRKRELSLRFSHFSNANMKSPNPGENFLQLRYAAMF